MRPLRHASTRISLLSLLLVGCTQAILPQATILDDSLAPGVEGELDGGSVSDLAKVDLSRSDADGQAIADADGATTTVPTTDAGLPAPCTPKYPTGTTIAWSNIFTAWPSFGVRRRMLVPYNGYVAFQFTATQTPGQFGTFASADYPLDGDGFGQMSISREPGCFDAALLDARCLAPVGRFTSVGWANGASQYSCNLVPGQTYYLNMTYGGTTSSATEPHCPAGVLGCGADTQNQIQ